MWGDPWLRLRGACDRKKKDYKENPPFRYLPHIRFLQHAEFGTSPATGSTVNPGTGSLL
jgi:hypothetical protein